MEKNLLTWQEVLCRNMVKIQLFFGFGTELGIDSLHEPGFGGLASNIIKIDPAYLAVFIFFDPDGRIRICLQQVGAV